MNKILVIILILSCTLTLKICSGYASTTGHIPLFKTGTRESKKHTTNDLFKSYLELSSFRHKVLSQNISNVNTPGYKADEVTMPDDFDGLAGKGKAHRV